MFIKYKHEMVSRGRELRKNATKQENHLWYDYLRTYPVRMHRQKLIESFAADFYCPAAKLVIEVDGSQHFTPQGMAYDKDRSLIFMKYGIKVIRFSNYEVDERFEAVCAEIDRVVNERLPKF